MKKSVIIFLLLIVLALSAFPIYELITGSNKQSPEGLPNTIQEDKGNPSSEEENPSGKSTSSTDEEDEETPEEAPETPSTSAGGGEGGSGGGGDSGTSTSPCLKQISYSVEKFIKDQQCITYSGETCTKKDINCSLEIKNYDPNIAGDFKLEMESIYLEDRNTILASENFSFFLSPLQSRIVEKSFSFTGEIANQNLSCSYKTHLIPKKPC